MSHGFAERGPVGDDDRCLWCGELLRIPRGLSEGVGYLGFGYFCTLTCGWQFGRRLAEVGRRLTS